MASHRLKIAGLIVALAGLYGLWLWARDSSVFAVQKVEVQGLSGSAAPAIRASLEQSARTMTTTHVDVGRLETAVAPFGAVKSLSVDTHLLHGITIRVEQQQPVMAVVVDGKRLPVSADGLILHDVTTGELPTVDSAAAPSRGTLQDSSQLQALELLDIAPAPLRGHVARVSPGTGALGLTAYLRSGPTLYFGDAQRLHAKWAAAARVLSDPSARGARYIDLRVPDRAAAQIADPVTLAGQALSAAKAGGAAP